MVTKCSFRHNFTGASNQKTSLTKLVKEMSWRQLNIESFGHKMFILSQPYIFSGTSKPKTYLTKVALTMEMPCRPLSMESFHHKMFILSQLY